MLPTLDVHALKRTLRLPGAPMRSLFEPDLPVDRA